MPHLHFFVIFSVRMVKIMSVKQNAATCAAAIYELLKSGAVGELGDALEYAASIAGETEKYAVVTTENGADIHLFANGNYHLCWDGVPVELDCEVSRAMGATAFIVRIHADQSTRGTVRIRIPASAPAYAASLNGESMEIYPTRGYLVLNMLWRKNDVMTLMLREPEESLEDARCVHGPHSCQCEH